MPLDRAWICSHIPHHGRMCLLDEVLSWSETYIECRASSHHATDHPLRAGDRLGSAAGIEYAAQAMAVHGALSGGALQPAVAATPAAGFLASVRGVQLHVTRLDDVIGDLYCEATRTAGDAGSALYEFLVRSQSKTLISGRATVVLDAAALLFQEAR